jgi:hypothetical protein
MHTNSSSKGIGTAGRSNDMCKSGQQSIQVGTGVRAKK